MTDIPLPEPLVPGEVDLQDFPFMPLHVARLRDSDFNVKVSDAEFRCAITLWCAAWHQLPAGSLPDDDATLTHLAGLGRDQRTWKKARTGALYGFVKCSDGRLYHPTIAEQVVEAWESKLRQRHRTYCAAVRKHNSRHANDQRDTPDFEGWLSQGQPVSVTRDTPVLSHVTPPEKPRDIGSKRQGQGQGQGNTKEEEPDGSFVASPATNGSGSGSDDLFEPLDPDAAPAEPPPPEFKPEHVVEAWNKLADECGLPRVVKLSDQRRRQLKARMRDHTLDDFATAIEAIRRSSFLRDGNATWRGANFDFFLQPSSFLKLIEGHYEQPTH